LKRDEVLLRVGNSVNVSVVAIGNVEFTLPSRFLLKLKNSYFIPYISRNIIYISLLYLDDYHIELKDKYCSLDNIDFGSVHLLNNLYILDIENHVLTLKNSKKIK
jgi:hypothetical protein